MSKSTERAARLQGMLEGSDLDKNSKEGVIISELLQLVYDLSKELEDLREDVDDLDHFVDEMDDDLSDLEEAFWDEMDDEDEDEELDGEDDGTVEYLCPHCGAAMSFKVDEFDFDEDYFCPTCHKPLFPEVPDGDDEE